MRKLKTVSLDSEDANRRPDESKVGDYIDLTPTWSAILPTWLMMYRQAITGDCTNPSLIRANAEAEFKRMAEAADKWNAHCKELQHDQ